MLNKRRRHNHASDHRVSVRTCGIAAFLAGEGIKDLSDSLHAQDEADRLAELIV